MTSQVPLRGSSDSLVRDKDVDSSAISSAPLAAFEPPWFARATTQSPSPSPSSSTHLVPQAIAHRGFKAKHPENSMVAFRAAAAIGAQALEADVRLARDGVAVVAHDASLERCFGATGKDGKGLLISDCDWPFLSTLRTLASPHVGLPRLTELLAFLAQRENAHLWVLLDIKVGDDFDGVIRAIKEALEEVEPLVDRPWKDRILLGVWGTKFVPICEKYLPGYPLACIASNILAAKPYFQIENVAFNMLQFSLMGLGGQRFLKKCRALDRPVFAWTVNSERWMRWCIQHQVDGVISDDPERFIKVRDEYLQKSYSMSLTWTEIWSFSVSQAVLTIYYWLFRKKDLGSSIDKKYITTKQKL